MPETTVNEDAPSVRFVGDVRTAGKIVGTYSIAGTEPMQEATYRSLRCGVALTYGLHPSRGLGSDGVADAF